MSPTPGSATGWIKCFAGQLHDLVRLHEDQGRVLERLAADLARAAGTSPTGLAPLNGHMADMAGDPKKSDSMLASNTTSTAMAPDIVLDQHELARLLRMSERSLRRLRDAGRVPAPMMLGRQPRWRRADIDAWIAKEQTG